MATLWERLEGDTSVFAFKLTFDQDPDNGKSATTEESSSWGGVEFWVAGQNLCVFRDADGQAERTHWYLISLIEWFVTNWDFIFHEERLPLRNVSATAAEAINKLQLQMPTAKWETWETEIRKWTFHHSILTARDGGIFPEIFLRRWQDKVEISWDQPRLPGVPESLRFNYSNGHSRFDPQLVAEPIYTVLQAAITKLLEFQPDSARFKAVSKGLAEIKASSRHHARVGLLAGIHLDIDALIKSIVKKTPKLAEAVQDAMADDKNDLVVIGSSHAVLMYGTVAPNINEADALILTQSLLGTYSSAASLADNKLVGKFRALNDRPWDSGYELAQETLDKHFNFTPASKFVDIELILKTLNISLAEIALGDRAIRGVAIAGDKHKTTVFLNRNSDFNTTEAGKRFTIAHELCHLLYDRSYGNKVALASGPWAPIEIEKRANAFAAMMLMPRPLIDSVISSVDSPVNSLDTIRAISNTLVTGPIATLKHLKNLCYIDEVEVDRIQEEFTNSPKPFKKPS